jgi:D-alanine-D-alanine ligase
MKREVRKIGLVYELIEDARETGHATLTDLIHWREPDELDAIQHSIEALGLQCIRLGSPGQICRNMEDACSEVDFIVNLSVGFLSRNRLSLASALYELYGIPFSGADAFSRFFGQHKECNKAVMQRLGISTPAWAYINDSADIDGISDSEDIFPALVKPAFEGTSVGIDDRALVHDTRQLMHQAEKILQRLGMPVIAERFIEGHEYKVGIIGSDEIAFMGMSEDITADGDLLGRQFIHVEDKQRGGYGRVRRDIEDPRFRVIKNDCLRIHQLLRPLDYCVFDLRVDALGQHYFIDINTDATLHPGRTLAQCCQLNGLSYGDMIGLILRESFSRWGLPWNSNTRIA